VKKQNTKISIPCAIMIVFTIVCYHNSIAQNGALKFSAGNINTISIQLTGDSTTWPVVISLAQRDVENNGFILSKGAIEQLKKFALLHKQVLNGKRKFTTLLKAGARVFASTELDNATRRVAEYDAQLKDGTLTTVTKAGTEYLQSLNEIEKEIREKRNEEIDARIAQKQGTVDKRKGFLGNWISASKDDLLAQSDGVKTGNASFAQLAFTDGVEVMIDQGSTVVIRESKMDKLDQTVRRNIALVKGSLLTKLTASAKERNNFTFQAGTSESQVKSGKFWASAIEERRVKLSNYDGTMDVNASNSNVRLASNEGTVVEKGKAPLPPVALLPPPQLRWDGIDSVIYNDNFMLQWNRIQGSVAYTIEFSLNKEFNNAVKYFTATQPSFALKNIDLGIFFVRLYGVDKLGLRGIESPTYRLVRVEDKLPPAIYVDGWETDRRYTALSSLTIKGTTEPDAKFVVDGKQIMLGAHGLFSFTSTIGQHENQIKISATDRSGNTRERILSIVPIDSNRVKKIEWNCPATETALSPVSEDISARGSAYPQMKITVTHGMEKIQVQTDSQGNWAISLKRIKGEHITLVFESISDNIIIVTKTLLVE
jgi:hypothetical protein